MNDEIIKKTIADNIRLERLRIRMTQEELAEKAGISFKYLNMLENYKTNPSIIKVVHICKVLNINLNTIYPM